MAEKKRSTLGSVGRAGLWGLLGSILATGKQLLIGPLFGATGSTDAFFAATQIPRRMGELLGFEVMKGALTSHYSGLSNEEAMSRHFSAVLNAILILGGIAAVVLVLLAGPLMGLIVKGFDDPVLRLSVKLARIVFPVVLCIGLTNLFTSLLNSLHVYNMTGIVRVVTNITGIMFIILFHRVWGVYSLAWGYLAGWFFSVLIQIPALLSKGVRYRPFFREQIPIIRLIISLVAPLFLGILASQVNAFVQLRLASGLESGKVSAMNYSAALFGTLIVVATQPFFLVLLPKIARAAKDGDTGETGRRLVEYSAIFAFIFIPLVFFLYAKAHVIIGVIFGRGDFDLRAINITSDAFRAYAVGLFFWAQSLLLMQFFLAGRNTKLIGIVDLVTITIHIGLNFLLTPIFDLFGLVIAMSIAHGLRYVAYTFLLSKKAGYETGKTVSQQLLCVVASIPGAVLLFFTHERIFASTGKIIGWTVLGEAADLLISGLVFFSLYFLLARLLRISGPGLALRELGKTSIMKRFV